MSSVTAKPKKSFKGWTIPGPEILPAVGTNDPYLFTGIDETLDALSGHFRIFQLKKGHRFSTDDVLTAWYGSICCPTAQNVLDLGSGIGSVAMVAAWRLPGAKFVTIEAQEKSFELAKRSARLNGLLDRFDMRQGDFRDGRVFTNLKSPAFDLILGSPPYFSHGSGQVSDQDQKEACRFETRGEIADYCQTASKHLAPGGVFCCVFPLDPVQQEKRVFNAAKESGLTVFRMRPVCFKEGLKPLIGLFAMIQRQDLPEEMRNKIFREAALTIRNQAGDTTDEYKVVKLSFGFPPS